MSAKNYGSTGTSVVAQSPNHDIRTFSLIDGLDDDEYDYLDVPDVDGDFIDNEAGRGDTQMGKPPANTNTVDS